MNMYMIKKIGTRLLSTHRKTPGHVASKDIVTKAIKNLHGGLINSYNFHVWFLKWLCEHNIAFNNCDVDSFKAIWHAPGFTIKSSKFYHETLGLSEKSY